MSQQHKMEIAQKREALQKQAQSLRQELLGQVQDSVDHTEQKMKKALVIGGAVLLGFAMVTLLSRRKPASPSYQAPPPPPPVTMGPPPQPAYTSPPRQSAVGKMLQQALTTFASTLAREALDVLTDQARRFYEDYKGREGKEKREE